MEEVTNSTGGTSFGNTHPICLPKISCRPCDPTAVMKYLRERKRMNELRISVMNRFDKFIDHAVALNNRRIRGMAISQAWEVGTELINRADFPFLLELKNVRSKFFLSTLFDSA